jgi:hypothetical protein
MPHLQQCVYFLSVAIKDREAVLWLAQIGLGFSQAVLLRYLISDIKEERQVWEVVRDSGSLRKIAFAAFLKVLLPLETLAAAQTEEVKNFRKDWDEAYGWLPNKERGSLMNLAHRLMGLVKKTFQERLERATFLLIHADL